MINPDWTYNALSGAQSAVNLEAGLPDDDNDTIVSVASCRSESEKPMKPQPVSVYGSTLRCFVSNVADGVLVGAATASAISIFPLLFRGKLVQAVKAPFVSGNLKISIFFGILLGVYNTGRYHVRMKCNGHKLSERLLRALVAICIGYSGSLLSHRVRKFMALFLLSRAFETKIKAIHRELSVETQRKLSPLTAHADILLTTVSMGINGAAWIAQPALLDKSYLRFLESSCGYPVHAIRQTPKMFNSAYQCDRFCQPLHPQVPHGCFVENCKFGINHYFKFSILFYYKLYAIPLLLATLHKRKLSLTALRYFVQRTARSALFLTTGGFCMTSVFCMYSKLTSSQTAPHSLAFVGGMSSGAMVFLEPKSRRIELGLYLFTQAMHVIASYYATHTNLWYPPAADLLAMTIGFYQLMAAYDDSARNENSLLRPFYVSTLKKIFDYEERSNDAQSVDRMHAWSTVTRYLAQ